MPRDEKASSATENAQSTPEPQDLPPDQVEKAPETGEGLVTPEPPTVQADDVIKIQTYTPTSEPEQIEPDEAIAAEEPPPVKPDIVEFEYTPEPDDVESDEVEEEE